VDGAAVVVEFIVTSQSMVKGLRGEHRTYISAGGGVRSFGVLWRFREQVGLQKEGVSHHPRKAPTRDLCTQPLDTSLHQNECSLTELLSTFSTFFLAIFGCQ
jgi:hypothetical protein